LIHYWHESSDLRTYAVSWLANGTAACAATARLHRQAVLCMVSLALAAIRFRTDQPSVGSQPRPRPCAGYGSTNAGVVDLCLSGTADPTGDARDSEYADAASRCHQSWVARSSCRGPWRLG